MKKIIYIICILTILVGCYKKDVFTLPSKEEVEKYLIENNMTPITFKNEDSSTLVLYEKINVTGLVILSVYKDSDILNAIKSTNVESGNEDPISTSLVSLGSDNRVTIGTIIIKSSDILHKAYKVKIEIKTRNGLVEGSEFFNNKKGAIIYFKRDDMVDAKIQRFIIFDKDGKEIYVSN
ncbi:hypothetical protein SH2C18_14960 [Clostridium sediminicola]|uniref:hypothetical protein n=1 Tax=Clostridium sediminicola TaxID=3114879 RepID=UPI0031F26569